MTNTEQVGYHGGNAEFWCKIMREKLDRYRVELTDPAVLQAMGDVAGRTVVDAGCGEGYLSRLLAGMGGKVTGIDLDTELIKAAQDLENTEQAGIQFVHGTATDVPLPDQSVDIIVANHLVNDVEDINPLFTEFARLLKPGGRLVILCLHPSFYWARRGLDEADSTWPDRYFETEPRVQSFNVAGIQSPHSVKAWYRPLEDYGTAIHNAGLVITNLSEPHPTPEQQQDPWWQAGWTKPMFLLISAATA